MNNTLITIPGPVAVEILKKASPQKKKSETAIADIHMMLFGTTKRIAMPKSK